MRKLAFMLLMIFCFLLGTWHGAAKTNPTTSIVVREVESPFADCDHIVWNFYCRGEQACNCILGTDPKTGCGDGPNHCCKTCTRGNINTQ